MTRGYWAVGGISIHVLRVEDDKIAPAASAVDARFQSTSSVWRTTEAHDSI